MSHEWIAGRGPGRLQHRAYEVFEASHRDDPLGLAIDVALIALIALNITAVILETVPSLHVAYGRWFHAFELFSVAVFTVEYAFRLWACVADDDPTRTNLQKRLAYARRPIALVDLFAILPFYLSFIFPIDLRFLRVLRLLRIFKLTRYSSAMTMLLDVLRQEASAFGAAFFIMLVLLILSASGVYLAEHAVQPENFGSIPHSMWWAVATLTTVGYGDVTPVTVAGKVFGACVMVIGIGMAALPAGILASGMADQMRRKREALATGYSLALEDGEIDEHEANALRVLQVELGLSDEAADEVLAQVRKTRDDARGPAPPRADAPLCPHCGQPLA